MLEIINNEAIIFNFANHQHNERQMLQLKFIVCILGVFIISSGYSRVLQALPDSCLFEYRLLSNENIPYPDKTIKTPSDEGLFSLKFESKIDIFEEDKENEIFITDHFSNTISLYPTDSLARIKVSLKDTNNLAIAAKTILFRNPLSKEVYIGQTNNMGAFEILLPKGVDFGVRLNQNGNRIPANKTESGRQLNRRTAIKVIQQ